VGKVALRKVLRDLWLARGRTAVLVVATALSLVAVGAVLGAYAILTREMPRSFLSSNPASATLVVDGGITSPMVDAVRQRPNIADADRRGFVRARAEIAPDTWMPLRVFVDDDFAAARVETIAPIEGAWPPPDGSMLLDRTSMPLLETPVGATMTVSTANGRPSPVQIAGVVFDGGVAPAWQERTGSAYVTPATLAMLGEPADLDLLKVVVADDPFDATAIERTAQDLSAWLGQQGVVVEEIQIPPPGQHPHQGLMNLLALVLLLFSLLALGLSGLLVATLISAMLARHVRQIGAMKAIGAQPSHVGLMYGAMVLAMSGAAVVLAIVPAVIAAWVLATIYADRSNVELASRAVPWWVLAVVMLAGLLTPLLAAAMPVTSASQMTVREAISEVGLFQGPTGRSTGSVGALAARLGAALGPSLVLALRHAFRRRGRLAVSLVLLAVGGGTFMSGLNVEAASDRQLASGEATLGYDLEVSLTQPQPTESLLQLVRAVPGVAYAEPLGIATVATVRPGEIPVSGTHKDGGHGSQRVYALAPDTRFRPAVGSGRWLEPGDVDAIVVMPGGHGDVETAVGDTVSLSIAGRTTEWHVVGLMAGLRGPGAGPGGLYVSDAGFARATGQAGSAQAVRIITTEHDETARRGTLRALERSLTADGIGVASVLDADWRNTVVRAHVAIVQGALGTLGLVLGVVGALTLASTMSLSVVERTRELGVMQTIGATPARVIWVVMSEALFIGALSWFGAVAIALLLSSLIGARIGSFLFGGPLPLVVSPVALLAWLAVALLGGAAASALPARAASRLTIRETLAYA
jgi:putative ABC transport system permease protein